MESAIWNGADHTMWRKVRRSMTPLSIYGHQVDYLSCCTVLTGKTAQSERLEGDEQEKSDLQITSVHTAGTRCIP